jgi:hypothetical protein
MKQLFINNFIVISFLFFSFSSQATKSETHIKLCETLVEAYINQWNTHQNLALDIQNGVYNWSPEILKSYLNLINNLGDCLFDIARNIEKNDCELPENSFN